MDAGRICRWHDEHEPVAGEHDRLLHELLRKQLCRNRRIRGGEHIGRSALRDLRSKSARRAEGVLRAGIDLRKDVGQRCGRVDGDPGDTRRRVRVCARRGSARRKQRAETAAKRRKNHGASTRYPLLTHELHPKSPFHQCSTMTDVDLITATMWLPGLIPSSATESAVTIAVSTAGSVTTISTWAIRPSTFTSRTIPLKRLRALMWRLVSSPRSRSISLAVTIRRLLESRFVLIRPWRSQRRSVSRLIPSVCAASLAL